MPVDIPTGLELLEKAESVSSTQVAYSPEGGSGTSIYFYKKPQSDPNTPADPISQSDLQSQALYFLGSVDPSISDGRVQRQLPLAAPFPDNSLYCSSIRRIVGMGNPTFQQATSSLAAPCFPYYALYPCYAFDIEWGSRPYSVQPDSAIQISEGTYYDDDDDEVTFWYANEWLRFCDF